MSLAVATKNVVDVGDDVSMSKLDCDDVMVSREFLCCPEVQKKLLHFAVFIPSDQQTYSPFKGKISLYLFY